MLDALLLESDLGGSIKFVKGRQSKICAKHRHKLLQKETNTLSGRKQSPAAAPCLSESLSPLSSCLISHFPFLWLSQPAEISRPTSRKNLLGLICEEKSSLNVAVPEKWKSEEEESENEVFVCPGCCCSICFICALFFVLFAPQKASDPIFPWCHGVIPR